MNSVVEMFRDAAELHGRDRFSCSLPAWDFLRDLGEAFGWGPRGTTYMSIAYPSTEIPARHNYQPGHTLDHKRVEADDALAWANALEAAKGSPYFEAMIEARIAATPSGGAPIEASLRSLIEEFTEYAYGGAFAFAISPEPAPRID